MNSKYNENDKSITCSASKSCGSCKYIGVPYETELKGKTEYVQKQFKGLCNCELIAGMYRPVFYRNKVHVVVGSDTDKNIITGTYQENSHILVPVERCMIEDHKAGDIIATLRELFQSFKYVPYDEDKKRGFIRHILIKRGFSTNEIMLVLVTSEVQFPSKNHFIKALLQKHPEITTIVQNINAMSTSMILGKRSITLYGQGYIEDVLCGSRFRISAQSFYQINPAQTEKLYKTAIRIGNIGKSDTVIDAYCGIGTIGITLAPHAKKVIGVELNSQAVKDAEVNAKMNGIKNISFVNSDAGEFLVAFAEQEKADVVMMDPPRAGSSPEFLGALLKIKPDRIVYISCNPETQARDVRVLKNGGYEIKACKPFDMFPHTAGIECIVLLEYRHV